MWLFQHSPSFILFKSPWQYVHPLDRGRGQTLFSEGAVIWFHWHLENTRITTKLGWEIFWQLLQTYKLSAWYWWHRTDFPVFVVETSKPTQSWASFHMCSYLENKRDRLSRSQVGILNKCPNYRRYLKSTDIDFIYEGKISGSILFHLTLNQCVGSFTSVLFYKKRNMINSNKIFSSSWSGEQNYMQKTPERRMRADKLHFSVTFVHLHS